MHQQPGHCPGRPRPAGTYAVEYILPVRLSSEDFCTEISTSPVVGTVDGHGYDGWQKDAISFVDRA